MGSTVGFVPVPPHPVRPGKEREGVRERGRETERARERFLVIVWF